MNLLVAYHGCDVATRDALVNGRTRLRPSSNPYDWLGDGIYFFERDWRRALQFASTSYDRPQDQLTRLPIHNPGVVGAILCIERCLDMSTQDGIDEFAKAYRAMIEAGVSLRPNKAAHRRDIDRVLRHLDRRVFNRLHELRAESGVPPYDAVRGAFPQGRPVAPSSSIKRRTHVQIALRNPACILGYFRVFEGEDRGKLFGIEEKVGA